MYEKIRVFSNKKIVRETAVYGITNMFYSGLPLLLMPFLITVLNPADYGLIDFFKTFTLVLTPILGLSTVNSISRFFYDLETNDFKTFVSSILIFHVFTALIGIIILFILGCFLPEKYRIIGFLSIFFFLFNQITEALLQIFRVKKEVKNYFLIRIGGVVLDLILLTLFYFVLSEYDWTYRVYPNVISTILIGLICVLILYRKGFKLEFSKNQLLIAITYSTPLILHMLSGYILNMGDRFFILHYVNEIELGKYVVAYQIGMAINFFYSSFNLAWTPTFFEWMKQEKYDKIKKIKKIIYISIPLIGTIIFLIFLFLNNFLTALKKYDISILLVLLVTLAYVISCLYKFESNYFLYHKKVKILSKITLISALISIVGNFILIPQLGILGAAIATLLAFLFLYIFVTIKNNQKDEKINT